MSELANWMLQWTLSVPGLLHLAGISILAGAAVRFSRTRSVGRFWFVALVLWLVAALACIPGSSTVRAAVAGALWALSVIAVYAISLAIPVAKAKPPRTIFLLSAVLFILQAPLSLLSGLYFACYIGHDCP